MLHRKSIIQSVAVFFFLLFLSGPAAHAYIDPGTGSYMLQIAIAFLVGALFSIKIFWKRIMAFLKLHFSKKKKDGDPAL